MFILYIFPRDLHLAQVSSGLASGGCRIRPSRAIWLTPIAVTLVWATALPSARADQGSLTVAAPLATDPERPQNHPDLLASAGIAPPESQLPTSRVTDSQILESPPQWIANPTVLQQNRLTKAELVGLPKAIDPELGEIKLLPKSSKSLPTETSQPLPTALPNGPLPQNIPDSPAAVGEISNGDPELGEIRIRPSTDDELGTIRERPKPKMAKVQTKSVYLQAHADYFSTSNAFSAKDKISDGFSRTGLTLFYAPPLGRKTYLITSVDANVVRYGHVTELNYNELRFRAGVSQELSPTMFAELGWSNQQLFASGKGFKGIFQGDRYLKDNSLRFELSRRDSLNSRLSLSTFYQLRRSFTNRADSDRLSNTFYTSLSYKVNPRVDLALDYQYNLSKYLYQDRLDHFNQVLGRVSWKTSKSVQANFFVGYSFGFSSENRSQFGRRGNAAIDFNGWLLGVNLVVNTPLF